MRSQLVREALYHLQEAEKLVWGFLGWGCCLSPSLTISLLAVGWMHVHVDVC